MLEKDLPQNEISRAGQNTDEIPLENYPQEASDIQKKEQISPTSSGCLSPSNCKDTNICASDFKKQI